MEKKYNPLILDDPSSETLISEASDPHSKSCGLYFARGITVWNFLCLLLLTFGANQCHKIAGQFSTLLLQDKDFYDVDLHSLGRTRATFKTIIGVLLILLSFFGRFFYEVWSYRTLIPMVMFVASASVFALPWGQSLYPGMLTIEFTLLFSLFVEGLNPMMVDYLQNRSKGLALSYNHIIACIATVTFSFGYIQIFEWTGNILVPIITVGCVSFLIFIYLAIFVKNASYLPQKQYHSQKKCCARLTHHLAEGWIYTVNHKLFLLIFFGTFLKHMVGHVIQGSLVVYLSKYVYQGDVIQIANHVKYLSIANIFEIFLLPVVGCLFDRYSARLLYPIFSCLVGCCLFGIYLSNEFTSPFAFTLQISARVFISVVGFLLKASLILHTPIHLKAGLISIQQLLTRLTQVADQQMSGPILDSNYALSIFLIGGIMSITLTIIFMLAAIYCKKMFTVEREHCPLRSINSVETINSK